MINIWLWILDPSRRSEVGSLGLLSIMIEYSYMCIHRAAQHNENGTKYNLESLVSWDRSEDDNSAWRWTGWYQANPVSDTSPGPFTVASKLPPVMLDKDWDVPAHRPESIIIQSNKSMTLSQGNVLEGIPNSRADARFRAVNCLPTNFLLWDVEISVARARRIHITSTYRTAFGRSSKSWSFAMAATNV